MNFLSLPSFKKALTLIICLLIISGCASTQPGTGTEEPGSQDAAQSKLLGDMPLPQGSSINNSESLILGSGAAWTGRLHIKSPFNALQTYVFFRDEFPKAGWTLVSSMTSKKSIMVFLKNDRSVTIEIEETMVSWPNKSTILLTVAPKPSKTP